MNEMNEMKHIFTSNKHDSRSLQHNKKKKQKYIRFNGSINEFVPVRMSHILFNRRFSIRLPLHLH